MHTIDVTKGTTVGTVSAEWARRPADERFLNLSSLHDFTAGLAAESHVQTITAADIEAISDPAHPDLLRVRVGDVTLDPNHWSFGQACGIAGVPAAFLRQHIHTRGPIPGPLAGLNLNYGLRTLGQKPLAAYLRQNGTTTLRALTSTKYGRIFDHEVVAEVMKLAGNGTGDAPWKVPGQIDWGAQFGPAYNARAEITLESTTLYASDRDIFLFLVDDLRPIEVGKLASGEPDLIFRGFYVWNSEVGSRTYGCATMYLRGSCQNRMLWGVEGFSEASFKHTAGAPAKFLEFAAPALASFAQGSESKVVEGVTKAKETVVAATSDDRLEFLAKFGFSEKQARALITIGEVEEGKTPASVWDFAQAITAKARSEEFQADRLALEGVAGKMLNRVTA